MKRVEMDSDYEIEADFPFVVESDDHSVHRPVTRSMTRRQMAFVDEPYDDDFVSFFCDDDVFGVFGTSSSSSSEDEAAQESSDDDFPNYRETLLKLQRDISLLGEEVLVPTPELLKTYLPEHFHVFVVESSKKDCRMWLWKGAQGREALQNLKPFMNQIEEEDEVTLIQKQLLRRLVGI